MRRIVANRIRTPDGTVLQSFHVHDYKSYTDKNGLEYMVDDGLEYLRRNVNPGAEAEELSVYEDDPFALIRRTFHWGTRGKNGNQPLRWVPLIELETNHIQTILELVPLRDHIKDLFERELEVREEDEV